MTFFAPASSRATPIIPLNTATFAAWLKKQPKPAQQWIKLQRFEANPDSALLLPDAAGNLQCVLVGCLPQPSIWSIAQLPALLPEGTYKIDADWSDKQIADAALGFALAQYQFDAYKPLPKKKLQLCLPKSVRSAAIMHRYEAIALARDLINTPANDMTPLALANAARSLAKQHNARCKVIAGPQLLKENFPAIHAVGRASVHPPQFVELNWGKANHPLVVLVGKGVTFDTGGLDVKPYSAMRLMKKDMGGAATTLGLAHLIMAEKLPIRLKLLIPTVENSISGDSFRPQDILQTRKGLTVEIGSPDAEGRVILADALFEGDQAKPALMIDIATLTGAARAALGTELPALYSNRDEIALDLARHGLSVRDPMWQMPLWQGYAKYIASPIADLTNSPNYGFAGSVTAALFLQRFVSESTPWVHLDSYAWNAEPQPGRPVGGEALGLRAIYSYLYERFAKA